MKLFILLAYTSDDLDAFNIMNWLQMHTFAYTLIHTYQLFTLICISCLLEICKLLGFLGCLASITGSVHPGRPHCELLLGK